jgi:hypothetical protein
MGQEDWVLGSRTGWDITMWMRGYEEDWARKAAFCKEGRFFHRSIGPRGHIIRFAHYRPKQISLPASLQKAACYLGPSWREKEPMNLLFKMQFATFP